MVSILLSLILCFSVFNSVDQPNNDPCEIYGKVFYEKDPQRAHFRVYVEDSESFADVIVFKEVNALYADRPGHWATVSNHGLADVYIYIEKNRSLADFSIYYTDIESFAGCNR
ncbi:DUF6150 family protein [Reichenbachiella agarivorans]|uniref:DUF6150 family protein n=1 Tax=Reichenbachiella agarivorans TaxID=2979464 RepID=A0ABY6CZ04_9BACT|nr:DUF6150 family protein [Reichenbachiella agarivorans]UXP33465.1 DUF6150 family protein [Reichenbachiella agarivorans]